MHVGVMVCVPVVVVGFKGISHQRLVMGSHLPELHPGGQCSFNPASQNVLTVIRDECDSPGTMCAHMTMAIIH